MFFFKYLIKFISEYEKVVNLGIINISDAKKRVRFMHKEMH